MVDTIDRRIFIAVSSWRACARVLPPAGTMRARAAVFLSQDRPAIVVIPWCGSFGSVDTARAGPTATSSLGKQQQPLAPDVAWPPSPQSTRLGPARRRRLRSGNNNSPSLQTSPGRPRLSRHGSGRPDGDVFARETTTAPRSRRRLAALASVDTARAGPTATSSLGKQQPPLAPDVAWPPSPQSTRLGPARRRRLRSGNNNRPSLQTSPGRPRLSRHGSGRPDGDVFARETTTAPRSR